MPEKYCKDCNRWFNSHEALEQHMKFSSKHLFRCEPCAREFFSKEARVAHWQKNISHLYTYCLRCQVNYATPEELNLHYINGAAHRNTYDARCNIHFANSQDMLRHKQATPATHFLCLPCGLDCATSAELTAHWQDSEIHEGQYDARCDCLFDTSDARIAHENASPKHNVCQQCRLDFQALYLLQEHWRTTEVHKYTYDNFCRVDFATPQLLLSHKKAGEGKHHVCEPCALDHRTIEELKDHLRTAEVHRGSFCSKCETHFDTASKLKVHTLSHQPKPLACYGCVEGTEYTSTATMFGHLESGSCSAGWTVRHINALICQSSGSSSYIIDERKPWLLAGPPRTEAQDSDQDPKRNSWRCPLCTKSYLSKPDLTRHLQTPDCYQSYPNVLKCPECATGFTKLSKLLQHVETNICSASVEDGSIAKLLEHMEANLSNTSQQLRLLNFEYRLECDLVQPRKLIVKVASMTDLISLYH